jgi:hypothetical protein
MKKPKKLYMESINQMPRLFIRNILIKLVQYMKENGREVSDMGKVL